MLDAAAAARTAEASGEGVGKFAIFPETEEQARALGQHAFEGWEYYCTPRAQHRRSAKPPAVPFPSWHPSRVVV
jgi:hypothetical protein